MMECNIIGGRFSWNPQFLFELNLLAHIVVLSFGSLFAKLGLIVWNWEQNYQKRLALYIVHFFSCLFMLFAFYACHSVLSN